MEWNSVGLVRMPTSRWRRNQPLEKKKVFFLSGPEGSFSLLPLITVQSFRVAAANQLPPTKPPQACFSHADCPHVLHPLLFSPQTAVGPSLPTAPVKTRTPRRLTCIYDSQFHTCTNIFITSSYMPPKCQSWAVTSYIYLSTFWEYFYE